jgi:hypothetical protein
VFSCFVAVAKLVEALRYKPEGRGSILCGVSGLFRRLNTSVHTVALGSRFQWRFIAVALNCSYREPHDLSPRSPSHFHIDFNILSSTSRFFKYFFPLAFPNDILYNITN